MLCIYMRMHIQRRGQKDPCMQVPKLARVPLLHGQSSRSDCALHQPRRPLPAAARRGQLSASRITPADRAVAPPCPGAGCAAGPATCAQ